MNIIFTMCFTGSLLFLLYLFANKVFRGIFSHRLNYAILKIVLFFFLTPLGFLKPLLYQTAVQDDFRLAGTLPIMITTPYGRNSNLIYQLHFLITAIWVSMAIAVFVWQQIKYFSLKKLVKRTMTEISDAEIESFMNDSRQTMGIKRKIMLFQSNYASPFTTGILNPVIVLPSHLPSDKQKLILMHELIHIQHFDSLFLFLRHLVTCFYWFNPLVYLLSTQVEKLAETCCDESVIFGMEREERKCYASLIIDTASYDVHYRRTFASSFCNPLTDFKERIDYIMNPQKNSRYKKELSLLLAACLVICSSFTAFAYQPPIEIKLSHSHPDTSPLNIGFSDELTFQSGTYHFESPYGPILYDNQFTDANGTIYNIDDSNPSLYADCRHDYIDGIISNHSKKTNGGCVTQYYAARRCTKCTLIVQGAFIDTETHTICPH